MSFLRTALSVVVLLVSPAASPADYDSDTLTIAAASLLPSAMLQGKHYKIADDVLVSGYMNHFTVDSDFGQFTAVGNRSLKKLLHEINAIAELRRMTSATVATDAAVDAVANTGKSLAALASDPQGTVNNLGAGVSRLFKRTSKTAKAASESATEAASAKETDNESKEDGDQSNVASQVSSAYLGIGKAQRKIASELKVDPYSDNPVLQAELGRVAKISGTAGKVTSLLVPVPSVVDAAASVSNMVWTLSPTDLAIQNQETLQGLGYDDELIQRFFSNEIYSPTQQTAFVAAVKSLGKAKGSEELLRNAVAVETAIEGEFMIRSVLLTQIYHEKIDAVEKILSTPSGLVPIAITKSGAGIVFAPLDKLLWTKQVEAAISELAEAMDQSGGVASRQLWVEGDVSDLARNNIKTRDWSDTSEAFDKLEKIIND